MNSANLKLTIIVSNHSKAPRVVENVKNLLRQETNFGYKVFVTDVSCNAEQVRIITEGLKDHPEVELIINKKNVGYSKSHNKIKGKEVGQYILVVNPDIIFRNQDTLQKMVDYMESHPDVAVLGPKQINDTGGVALTVRAFAKFYLQSADHQAQSGL